MKCHREYYATARELEATANAIRVVSGSCGRIPWRDRSGFAEAILKMEPQLRGTVTPESFGAAGDGEQDDTAAWQAAAESGLMIRAAGDYRITEPIQFSNSVICDGTIWFDGENSATAVTIRGVQYKRFRLRVARRAQDAGECTGILVENCYNCSFALSAENFYYGLIFRGRGSGCCYNVLNRAITRNCKYHVSVEACRDDENNNGWCNENYFYSGRCSHTSGSLYAGDDYGIRILKQSNNGPNALHFLNWCLEGAKVAISGAGFNYCSFTNIRTEACTLAADFGEDASYNTVTVSYGTTAASMASGRNSITSLARRSTEDLDAMVAGTGSLASRTASDENCASGAGLYRVDNSGAVLPMLKGLQAAAGGLQSMGSGMVGFLVDVSGNKRLRVVAETTGPYRVIAVPFDAAGAYLATAEISISSLMIEKTASGYGKFFASGSDSTAATKITPLTIGAGVASVWVGIWARSAETLIRKLSIYGMPDNYEKAGRPTAVLDSIPTSQGFYPEQTVYQASGGNKWVWNGATWDAVSL